MRTQHKDPEIAGLDHIQPVIMGVVFQPITVEDCF